MKLDWGKLCDAFDATDFNVRDARHAAVGAKVGDALFAVGKLCRKAEARPVGAPQPRGKVVLIVKLHVLAVVEDKQRLGDLGVAAVNTQRRVRERGKRNIFTSMKQKRCKKSMLINREKRMKNVPAVVPAGFQNAPVESGKVISLTPRSFSSLTSGLNL